MNSSRLGVPLLGLALLLSGCPQSASGGSDSSSSSTTTTTTTATASTAGTTGTTGTAGSSDTGTSSAAATSSAGTTASSSAATTGTSGTSSSSGTSSTTTTTNSSSSSGTTGAALIHWTSMAFPTSIESMSAVSGTSLTDIYVGGSPGELIHFNGSQWIGAYNTGNNDQITGLYAAPGGAVYAVGSGLYTCDSNCSTGNFVEVSLTGLGCSPVAVCGSGTTVYAVGGDNQNQGCLLQSDGAGGWSKVNLAGFYSVTSCAVTPAGIVYIGAQGNILSYDPSLGAGAETINWPSGTGTNNVYVYFKSVWTDGTQSFAVGGNRRVFSRNSGGSWDLVLNHSPISTNSEDSSFNTLAVSGSEGFALGDTQGTHQAAHFDGTSWAYIPDLVSGTYLEAAWAASPDDFVAVGSNNSLDGLILRGHR